MFLLNLVAGMFAASPAPSSRSPARKRRQSPTRHRVTLGVEALEDRCLLSTVSNGLIAFNTDGDIYVMNPDGTGQINLTNNPAGDASPAWSPDATKIAFYSHRDGNPEIYVMNADGSNQTRLTNNPAQDLLPAWSPDGSKIVFESDRDGNVNLLQIYVMNADGSGVTNVTNNPAVVDRNPAWSPDGSKIAFARVVSGDRGQVYVMNADGTGQINLSNNAADDHGPEWSPDGSKIAFTSRTVLFSDADLEVYVMNAADGSGRTNLTNNPGVGDFQAAWAPDGSKIVFASSRDGNREIYVMNSDGSGQTRVTSNTADDGEPAWQPVLEVQQQVQIDIKPGSDPNSINLASEGVIPVAMFGSATFDVTMVDIGSVLFAGASVAHYAWEDVNIDGYMDLVLHFRTQDTNLRDLYAQLLADADTSTDGTLDVDVSTRQTATVSLTGALSSGDEFSGSDALDLFFSGKALRDLLDELAGLGMI